MASRSAHVGYLDGWRGIAIFMVLGGHFFQWPASRLGVEVFFVLSGFLMSQVLFESNISMGTFYKRRIARIFPTFYLFLAIMALWVLWTGGPFPVKEFSFNAAFLRAYMPAGPDAPKLELGHLWSLNVEEHSYIVLSLIALGRRNGRFVKAGLVLCVVSSLLAYAFHWFYDSRPLTESAIFRSECAALPLVASAAIRLWCKDGHERSLRFMFYSCVAVLVVSIVLSRKLGGNIALDYILKPLALAGIVNSLGFSPLAVRRFLGMAWLRWLGVTSFSLYLWQQPFFAGSLEGLLNPVLGLAITIAVGAISYYGFEGPTRRFIRGLGEARPSSVTR